MLDKIVTALTPDVSLEAKLTGVAVTIGTEIADVQSRLLTQEIRAFQRGEKGDKGDPGRDGKNGKDGKNGADGKDGKNGIDGKAGVDGNDGVSIVDTYIAADDHLLVKLSDGNEIDAGSLSDILAAKMNTVISTSVSNSTGATDLTAITGGISTPSFIQFDTTTAETNAVGKLTWNNTDGTLNLGLKGGNVTLQLGEEQVARVVNKAGIDLLEANYAVCRIVGATGQRLTVDLAQANSDTTSAATLGVVTETILKNQEGFITTSGQIHDVNTTGSLQGETWADGDTLYLSGTVAGQLTNVKPIAPIHNVVIGYVEYAHAVHGTIFVKVTNGYELNELHDVLISALPNNGDVLTYDSATALWKNTPASGTGSVTGVEVELDFGTVATRAQSFTISDALVSATSLIIMTTSGNAPTGRSADETQMESFTVSCLPSLGSFNATINSLQGAVVGKYKFNYLRV